MAEFVERLAVVWFVGQGLCAAALIIGLFRAAVARPVVIRDTVKFRLAVFFLAVALLTSILAPLTHFAIAVTAAGTGSPAERRDAWWALFLYALPMAFMALSLLLGIGAVMPTRASKNPGEPGAAATGGSAGTTAGEPGA